MQQLHKFTRGRSPLTGRRLAETGSSVQTAFPRPGPAGSDRDTVRLRLYHHPDGARVAYRETGTGPVLVLLHSLGLSHREWEPIVAPLSARFRVVLPDLPLHGDSEDRPRHTYSPEWLADVIAGFCAEVGRRSLHGRRPRPRRRARAAGGQRRAADARRGWC